MRGSCSAPNTLRDGIEGFPEVSEIEVIRHFTRLSTWNYAIDLGMYPLGSCTMKYNPRVNEFVARLDGIATEHPYQPQELAQGCLKILRDAAAVPARNHRHGRRHAPARRRRAGRADRPAADSRLPGEPRQSAQEGADSRFGARNQSGNGRHRRLRSRKHPLRRARADWTSSA